MSGHSFTVADQRVILNNGYRRGDVIWVVVRNWPNSATPEEMLADNRLVLGSDGEYRVRDTEGELAPPTPNWAYVFHGDRVAAFPIRMREDDFISFRTEELTSYVEVENFLRQFEHRQGSRDSGQPPNTPLQWAIGPRIIDELAVGTVRR